MADSSDSSDEEFEFRDPVTGEVVLPRSTLPTSSSNGSKSAAPPSSSTARKPTTVGAWATPSNSQPRAGPSGSQRGRDVGGSGSVQAQGQRRRQSTGGANEQPQTGGAVATANVSNGFKKRATHVISLSDTSDESAGEATAAGRDRVRSQPILPNKDCADAPRQVANGRRQQAATPLANGNVATAHCSSSRLERADRQQAASSEDELAIRPASARRPSHLLKRPRQSAPAAPAIHTNGADAAATAAKRASRPPDGAGRATTSDIGPNPGSTSAHSSNPTRRWSDASKQTASAGAVSRQATDATPRAGPSTSRADAPAQPGPSRQNPPASDRRKFMSTSSAAFPAVPPSSSASPNYRMPAALRKALGQSSPNGAALNGRSPPLTTNNLASSVSPTSAAAPSTSRIVKPKPILPAPRSAFNRPPEDHSAPRQAPRQQPAASSSSAAPALSGAARNDARQANDDQLPLNGRPDLENRQSATASQAGVAGAPARAKDTGDDSDIEILSEVPAIAAVGNAAPASQGLAGSVSSRSPIPQRAAEPDSSRSPTPVPRHERNLGFAGSSSPGTGQVGDQLEVQAGLLADEEDNEDEQDKRDGVPLRRQYSRVVPDSDEEAAGPSAPVLGQLPAAPRLNVSLVGNANSGSSIKAPRRSHQVARAMSGGFTARKSTTLSRPQSTIPAPVQADEDHLQGLPASATDKPAQVDEPTDGSSPAQPAPPAQLVVKEQARPVQSAPRPGVAKKSAVLTRPQPATPAPLKPAPAPSSSKRVAEGPPSDASDAANRSKRPRRAAAAAADAANGKSAQKARKTPRQRAETTAASSVAQVLGPIAIAGDDAGKQTNEMLQATSRADMQMRAEEVRSRVIVSSRASVIHRFFRYPVRSSTTI